MSISDIVKGKMISVINLVGGGTDYKKLIDDKKTELEPMFVRMREDAKQIYATKYDLLNAKGNKAKGAYSVNLLTAKLYINKAVARLTSVNRQAMVDSEGMTDEDKELIEQFNDDLQIEIDNRLIKRGEMDSFSQHAEIVCVRGPIAEQILLGIKDEKFIADSRPLDTLYFLYELDDVDMKWGCPFYRRYAADITAKYPKAKVSGKTAEVYDFWDDKVNIVYVDGSKVYEEENPYKYPPFVISFPSTTSALKDEDYLKRKGDSILHLCRTDDGKYVFEEENFIASILKTQAAETLKPPLQKPPKPDGAVAEAEEDYPQAGDILSTDSRIETVPKPDVRMSTRLYMEKIEKFIDISTFAALDYGTIDLPLAAVAIARIMEGKNEMLLPRLNCIAYLCQSAFRMKRDQFISLAQTIAIGDEGHKREYKSTDLEGDYNIIFRFHTTSQEQLAAGFSMAAAAGDLVDDKFKLEEIIRLPNPDEMLARRDAQAAKKNNPAILLFEQVFALIEQQEKSTDKDYKKELDTKARLHLAQLKSILRQRKATENVPLGKPLGAAEGEKEPTGLLPVFAQGRSKTAKPLEVET